jgi:hypothetical protein
VRNFQAFEFVQASCARCPPGGAARLAGHDAHRNLDFPFEHVGERRALMRTPHAGARAAPAKRG